MHRTSSPKAFMNSCVLFSALGLSLNLLWCTLLGHTPGFSTIQAATSIAINPRIFFLLGIFIASIAFMVFPRQLREVDTSLMAALPFVASGGTLCFLLAADQNVLSVSGLSIFGLICLSIGYSWFTARFILLLARTQSLNASIFCIVIALIVEPSLVPIIEAVTPFSILVILTTSIPLLNAVVFYFARKAALASREEESGHHNKTIFGVPVKQREIALSKQQSTLTSLIVMTATASLLLATVRCLSFAGSWGEGFYIDTPTIAESIVNIIVYALALVCFSYLTLSRTSQWDIKLRFQPAFIVIVAIMVVPLIQLTTANINPALLDGLMRINDSFAHLLFWSVIIVLLDGSDTPSYRMLGIGTSIYSAGSILWILFLHSTAPEASIFMIFVVYALMLILLGFTWHDQHDLKTPSDNETTPEETQDDIISVSTDNLADAVSQSINLRCMQLAEEYKLSPRETEIFILLAQGRTRAYIQGELVLAENTIKTHVSHIYTKLGIGDRQEMFDMLLDGSTQSQDDK